jgi:hypothetical protein
MTEEYSYYWNTRRTGGTNTVYSDEDVEFALRRSLGTPKDIPLDTNGLDPRISTELQPAEIIYRDLWHNQGLEATCGVWALVNAMRVSGVERDPDYIKTLLNYVIASLNSPEPGVSIPKMYEISVGRNLPGKLTLLSPDESLTHLSPLPSLSGFSGEKIVKDNARIIKKYVTENSALVVSRPSVRRNSERSHAVCIAGYRIDAQGYMDLQVIDSSRGVKFHGIEAFSRQLSVNPRRSLAVSRG